jgi:hypothetical protein
MRNGPIRDRRRIGLINNDRVWVKVRPDFVISLHNWSIRRKPPRYSEIEFNAADFRGEILEMIGVQGIKMR